MVSLSEQINTTAMGKFSQNLFIAMAQMEREQISERTKNGFIGMLEKGLYPFGGILPLGISKTKDKKLYYNEDIKKVKFIFKLYEKGYSCSQIRIMYMEKYNIKVNKNFIEQLVKRNIYKGYLIYNDVKYEFLKPIYRENKNKRNQKIRKLTKHNYMLKKYLSDFNCETQEKTLLKKKIDIMNL